MRIGVNIPDDLYQRMKHIKHTVNVSQVCREAIEAYVEDYERARARLESDGADEVVKRLSGEEEDRTVDWEELGWKDARDWVERVDPDSFEHLFHRIDVLGRQGRPIWIVPPPSVPDVKTFEEREWEHHEQFARQIEERWESDPSFDPRAAAEREYRRAWTAYVTAVREQIRQRREDQVTEMIKSRRTLPEPEVPDHLRR